MNIADATNIRPTRFGPGDATMLWSYYTPALPMFDTWRDQAHCQVNDDLWFAADVEQHARAVCRNCPVAQKCLEDALVLESDDVLRFGVRGGKSAAERRRMAKGA